MDNDPLVSSMRTAVQAAPSDVPLRRHLAELLAEQGEIDEAIQHAAAALHAAPADAPARALMRRLLMQSAPLTAMPASTDAEPGAEPGAGGLGSQLAARPRLVGAGPRRPVARAYGAQAPAGKRHATDHPAAEPVTSPAAGVTGGTEPAGQPTLQPAAGAAVSQSGPAGVPTLRAATEAEPPRGPLDAPPARGRARGYDDDGDGMMAAAAGAAPIDALLAMREDELGIAVAQAQGDDVARAAERLGAPPPHAAALADAHQGRPAPDRPSAQPVEPEGEFVPDARWAGAGSSDASAQTRALPPVAPAAQAGLPSDAADVPAASAAPTTAAPTTAAPTPAAPTPAAPTPAAPTPAAQPPAGPWRPEPWPGQGALAERGAGGGRTIQEQADLLAALTDAQREAALLGRAKPVATAPAEGAGEPLAWNLERVTVRLADIGGMGVAKERLEAAVLAPARRPELRRLYRQSLTGGVLLYGPPGCGKAFLARAVAGELGARYVGVRVRDIVEPGTDTDSADLSRIFEAARTQAPVLVLLQEIDVLSRRRDRNVNAAQAIERIAAELDSDATDAGVYVLGTSVAPWDVEPALRQSGRFGRSLLVMPPDQPARESILAHELARIGRTGAGDAPLDIPLGEVALLTEGYSCTDLEWLTVLAASAATKSSTRLSEAHLRAMIRRIPPSTEPWIQEAARIAADHPEDPLYAGLREYLRTSIRH